MSARTERIAAVPHKYWAPRPVHEAVALGLTRFAALVKDAEYAKRVSDEMKKVADEIAAAVKEATS